MDPKDQKTPTGELDPGPYIGHEPELEEETIPTSVVPR